MSILGSSAANGRNMHKTQVSKFLYGGRLDNVLKGHDKIVNGMEDPSFFAFTFGIDVSLTGLFGLADSKTNMIYDINTDRNYSVLTYLANAISPNTTAMISKDKTIKTDESTYADLNNLYTKDEYGNIIPNTTNENVKLTFSDEYINMKKFINGFKYITINHPYMLQSVEGLQDAYKKYYNSHKDSYLGGNDSKIKIKCLESMDLRMSALFDSYFKAVYNHKYRRMNIPRNLLRFDCWLLIHDMRNIKIDSGSLLHCLNSASPVTEDIVNNLSTVLFNFKNCFFDIDEIGSMLGNINNAEYNQTTFEFTFNYTDLDVYVNALADVLESSKNNISDISNIYREKYDLLDIYTLNNKTLDVSGLVNQIGSSIFNYATAGSTMGNVYDDTWSGLLSSLYSSITNNGVSSVINSAIGKGVGIAKNKIFSDK